MLRSHRLPRIPRPARTLATGRGSGAGLLPGLVTAIALALLPVTGSAQDYYGDVRPVLVEGCMGCHVEDGIGWSMEDPDDAFRRRRAVADMIVERRMPPWLAEPGHQDYAGDLSLSAEAVEMVRRWREAGFPEGTPRPDPPRPRPHAGFRADATVELMPGSAYLPNQDRSDDYRCFVSEWRGQEPVYLTGLRTVPGNRNVAHHAVIHAVRPELLDRFRELDEAEDGLGYQCFGGALPDRLGDRAERAAYEERYPDGVRELSRGSFWLAHWAPGMFGHGFPEGTGIPLEPGTGLVVQMHYYSREAPGQRDAGTRLELQVEAEVERPAFHLVQTRNAWLAGERNGSMVIPAGATATYEVEDRLGDLLGYVAAVTGVAEDRIQALELHSANLHMHAFGHSGRISLVDGDGRQETLLSIPRWNLAWQRDFTFAEPKVLPREALGDTSVRVECTYRNDTDGPVYGGYGSFDEMCFNFSYIAVREGEVATDGASRDGGGSP